MLQLIRGCDDEGLESTLSRVLTILNSWICSAQSKTDQVFLTFCYFYILLRLIFN